MRKAWLRLTLALVGLAAVARFLVVVARFVAQDLQMDLAIRIGGARAAWAGLSPYYNNLATDPRVWDGLATTVYSSFLYPPAVALLFLPLAVLPYGIAKLLWTLASCGALIGAMMLSARLACITIDGWRAFAITAIAATFQPLLWHMERGQVDTVLLLLTMAAAVMLSRRPFFSGFLWAPAIVLKLHCVFLLPFLALRQRWWPAIVGSIVMLLAMELGSCAVLGSGLEFQYWSRELPRIARIDDRHSPVGPELAKEVLDRRPPAPDGRAVLDGRWYWRTGPAFTTNATLVRPIRAIVERIRNRRRVAASALSTLSFACLFLLVAVPHLRRRALPLLPLQQLAFWLVALFVVILSAPMSWSMNLVWALPAVVLPFSSEVRGFAAHHGAAAAAAGTGFVWMAVPEIVHPGHGPFLYSALKLPAGLLLMLPFLLLLSLPPIEASVSSRRLPGTARRSSRSRETWRWRSTRTFGGTVSRS